MTRLTARVQKVCLSSKGVITSSMVIEHVHHFPTFLVIPTNVAGSLNVINYSQLRSQMVNVLPDHTCMASN